jgi:EF hand domain-containing protein
MIGHTHFGNFRTPCFYPRNGAGYQGNIADGNLDGRVRYRRTPFGGCYNRGNGNRAGYVLDFNRNGRYDKGRDGVLAFDMNRDGRIDRNDINNTNSMMKAATGNYDLNGDGRISWVERARGRSLQGQYARLDRNRDGRLSTHEIAAGGGKVWIDSSRGGGVSRNELHSPYRLPNSRGFGPSQRLDYVDPFSQHSHTSNNFWGGGWGGSCGGHGGYIPGRMYPGYCN